AGGGGRRRAAGRQRRAGLGMDRAAPHSVAARPAAAGRDVRGRGGAGPPRRRRGTARLRPGGGAEVSAGSVSANPVDTGPVGTGPAAADPLRADPVSADPVAAGTPPAAEELGTVHLVGIGGI